MSSVKNLQDLEKEVNSKWYNDEKKYKIFENGNIYCYKNTVNPVLLNGISVFLYIQNEKKEKQKK